jgi:hypothetical protein
MADMSIGTPPSDSDATLSASLQPPSPADRHSPRQITCVALTATRMGAGAHKHHLSQMASLTSSCATDHKAAGETPFLILSIRLLGHLPEAMANHPLCHGVNQAVHIEVA